MNSSRNSSNMLDKSRHKSLTDKSKLDAQSELFIRIIPDKVNKILSIIDSGCGMTKTDLVNNLGIITRSGTKEFIEVLQAGGSFTVTRDTSDEQQGKGIKITLYIKYDQLDFLEEIKT